MKRRFQYIIYLFVCWLVGQEPDGYYTWQFTNFFRRINRKIQGKAWWKP